MGKKLLAKVLAYLLCLGMVAPTVFVSGIVSYADENSIEIVSVEDSGVEITETSESGISSDDSSDISEGNSEEISEYNSEDEALTDEKPAEDDLDENIQEEEISDDIIEDDIIEDVAIEESPEDLKSIVDISEEVAPGFTNLQVDFRKQNMAITDGIYYCGADVALKIMVYEYSDNNEDSYLGCYLAYNNLVPDIYMGGNTKTKADYSPTYGGYQLVNSHMGIYGETPNIPLLRETKYIKLVPYEDGVANTSYATDFIERDDFPNESAADSLEYSVDVESITDSSLIFDAEYSSQVPLVGDDIKLEMIYDLATSDPLFGTEAKSVSISNSKGRLLVKDIAPNVDYKAYYNFELKSVIYDKDTLEKTDSMGTVLKVDTKESPFTFFIDEKESKPVNMKTAFPDDYFRQRVVDAVNLVCRKDYTLSEDNLEIPSNELAKVTNIYVYGDDLVSDITGVEYLTGLENLELLYQGLTAFPNLSNNKNLLSVNLDCNYIPSKEFIDGTLSSNVYSESIWLNNQWIVRTASNQRTMEITPLPADEAEILCPGKFFVDGEGKGNFYVVVDGDLSGYYIEAKFGNGSPEKLTLSSDIRVNPSGLHNNECYSVAHNFVPNEEETVTVSICCDDYSTGELVKKEVKSETFSFGNEPLKAFADKQVVIANPVDYEWTYFNVFIPLAKSLSSIAPLEICKDGQKVGEMSSDDLGDYVSCPAEYPSSLLGLQDIDGSVLDGTTNFKKYYYSGYIKLIKILGQGTYDLVVNYDDGSSDTLKDAIRFISEDELRIDNIKLTTEKNNLGEEFLYLEMEGDNLTSENIKNLDIVFSYKGSPLAYEVISVLPHKASWMLKIRKINWPYLESGDSILVSVHAVEEKTGKVINTIYENYNELVLKSGLLSASYNPVKEELTAYFTSDIVCSDAQFSVYRMEYSNEIGGYEKRNIIVKESNVLINNGMASITVPKKGLPEFQELLLVVRANGITYVSNWINSNIYPGSTPMNTFMYGKWKTKNISKEDPLNSGITYSYVNYEGTKVPSKDDYSAYIMNNSTDNVILVSEEKVGPPSYKLDTRNHVLDITFTPDISELEPGTYWMCITSAMGVRFYNNINVYETDKLRVDWLSTNTSYKSSKEMEITAGIYNVNSAEEVQVTILDEFGNAPSGVEAVSWSLNDHILRVSIKCDNVFAFDKAYYMTISKKGEGDTTAYKMTSNEPYFSGKGAKITCRLYDSEAYGITNYMTNGRVVGVGTGEPMPLPGKLYILNHKNNDIIEEITLTEENSINDEGLFSYNFTKSDFDKLPDPDGLYDVAVILADGMGFLSENYLLSYDGHDIYPTSLKMNVTSKTINAGETFRLTATVQPTNANVYNTVETWYSQDETIATVDSSGLVTGVGPGKTRIYAYTAKYPNYMVAASGYCDITVKGTDFNIYHYVEADKKYVPLSDGEVITLMPNKADKMNAYIMAGNSPDVPISFTTGDKNVVTVAQDKFDKCCAALTAVGVGSTEIKITVDGVTKYLPVTVELDKSVTGIELSDDDIQMVYETGDTSAPTRKVNIALQPNDGEYDAARSYVEFDVVGEEGIVLVPNSKQYFEGGRSELEITPVVAPTGGGHSGDTSVKVIAHIFDKDAPAESEGRTYEKTISISMLEHIPDYIQTEMISSQMGILRDVVTFKSEAKPTLADVSLGGEGTIKGTWTWDNPDTILTADKNSPKQYFKATFTPDDSKVLPFSASFGINISQVTGIKVTGSTPNKIGIGGKVSYNTTLTVVGAPIDQDDYVKTKVMATDGALADSFDGGNGEIKVDDDLYSAISHSADAFKVQSFFISPISGEEFGSNVLNYSILSGVINVTGLSVLEPTDCGDDAYAEDETRIEKQGSEGGEYKGYNSSEGLVEVDYETVSSGKNRLYLKAGYNWGFDDETGSDTYMNLGSKFTFKSDNTGVAAVAVNGDFTCINLGKAGIAHITITSKDAAKSAYTLTIIVKDYSPVLLQNKYTVKEYLEKEEVDVQVAGQNGSVITAASLDEESAEKFEIVCSEEKVTLNMKEELKGTLPKTTVKANLSVTTQFEGDNFNTTFPITVIIDPSKPKATIKNTSKANVFYEDCSADFSVKTTGGIISNIGLNASDNFEDFGFTGIYDNGVYTFTADGLTKDNVSTYIAKKSPKCAGELTISFDGYIPAANQTIAVMVPVVKTKPSLKVDSAILITGSTELVLPVIDSKAKKQFVIPDGTIISNKVGATSTATTLSPFEGKIKLGSLIGAEKITCSLNIPGTTEAVDLPITVKVASTPEILLEKKTITLNTNYPIIKSGYAMTGISLSVKGGASVPETVSISAPGKSAPLINSGYVLFNYNDETGMLSVGLNGEKPEDIKAGSYSFTLNGTVDAGGNPVNFKQTSLTVKISEKQPTAKLKATGKIDPINRDGSFISYLPTMTECEGKMTSASLSGENADMFEIKNSDSLESDGVIKVGLKNSAIVKKGVKYLIDISIMLDNGVTAVVPKVAITPAQSAVKMKLTALSQTFLRTGDMSSQITIDSTTAGYRGSLELVENTQSKYFELVFIESEGSTPEYYELRLKDEYRAIVKPGTYTLTMKYVLSDGAINLPAPTSTVKITVK